MMNSQAIPEPLLRALSEGIEVTEEPFAAIAAACGMEQEELLLEVERLLEEGIIRRFGAVLNHFAVGLSANAMVVWHVPAEEVERAGETMASFPAVTHCYERPPLPGFPYNLYTMIHATSWEECEAIIGGMSEQAAITEYLPLRTVREFKKSTPPLGGGGP